MHEKWAAKGISYLVHWLIGRLTNSGNICVTINND